MKELNKIQQEILIALKYLATARFRDLNKDKISTDLFTYHLKHLLSKNLIDKKDGIYSLTQAGRILVGRYDENSFKIQSKLHFSFVCKNPRNKNEFLIHTRKKSPFLDWSGFPSSKIDLNENYMENARTKFKKKTGLDGSFEFKGIHHVLSVLNGNIVEDKLFFIVKVDNLHGNLLSQTEDGDNKWIKIKNIFKNQKVFSEIEKYIEIAYSDKFEFFESLQKFEEI